MVADTPGWVFSRIAERIREHLGSRFDVHIVFLNMLPRHEELVTELFKADDGFDLIHFFWRETLSDLFQPDTWMQLMNTMEIDALQSLALRIASIRKTTWVCDHLFLDETLPSLWNRRCLAFATAYGVSSRILKQIYSGITPDREIHELQDGVDLAVFRPEERQSKDMVLVGWTGNSKWGRSGEDHKGLNTVIRPAISRLQAAGLKVRHRFCDRSQGWTPFEEMPQYYRSIDVFICASINEGTPNTVLEAMACGLPVVSTRVGIVDEVFGPLQRQFMIENRSVGSFEKALRRLVEDPALRARVGAENRARVRNWDWSDRIKAWGRFIESTLADEREPRTNQEQLAILNHSIEIARERLAHG